MMKKTWLASIILCAVACLSIHAQELVTGPPADTALTPVMSYALVGPYAGQEFDSAKEIGDAPGGFLFIHELSRNTAPMITGFDQLAGEYGLLGFKGFTLLLADDRTAAERRLKAVNGSLRLRNPIVLSLDGAEGPGNYALNRKCTLSLILTKSGQVYKSVAFLDTGENDLPELRRLIEETCGPMPENEKAAREWMAKQLPPERDALQKLAVQQAIELHWLHDKLEQLRQARRNARQQMSPGTMDDMSASTVVSGPSPQTALTPVMAYAPVGPLAGQEFDVAKEISDSPGALLFVHDWVPNTFRLVMGFDKMVAEYALLGLKSFTLVLAADRTKAESQLAMRKSPPVMDRQLSIVGKYGFLRLEKPIMLSLDGAEGPGNYALNRKATLTFLVTKGGKIHKSVGFTDTGVHNLSYIRQLINEVLAPVPHDGDELREFASTWLSDNEEALQQIARAHVAFGHSREEAFSRVLKTIEKMTGPIPQPSEALREIVEAWMPTEIDTLHSMVVDQAGEVFFMHRVLVRAQAARNRNQMQRSSGKKNTMQASRMERKETRDVAQPKTNPASESAVRQGKPPTDAKLNLLFRGFIRQTNSKEQTDAIFADIQKQAAESDQLATQVADMFKLMLSLRDRYGSQYAQELAETYLKSHAERGK